MTTFLLVMIWIWGYCLIGTLVAVVGHSVARKLDMSDDDSAWTAGLAGFLWPIGVWVLVAMMLIESGKRREERKHLAALRRGREEQERASLVAMGKRELWELERQRGEP